MESLGKQVLRKTCLDQDGLRGIMVTEFQTTSLLCETSFPEKGILDYIGMGKSSWMKHANTDKLLSLSLIVDDVFLAVLISFCLDSPEMMARADPGTVS